MSDKVFLDSNILIYCYSSDLKKQSIARNLAVGNNICISTQVLNETANVLFKKFGVGWADIERIITDFENNFFIDQVGASDIRGACKIAARYSFSFYDSLIISSASSCGCRIIYSEDLQHSQTLLDNIQIINPFK